MKRPKHLSNEWRRQEIITEKFSVGAKAYMDHLEAENASLRTALKSAIDRIKGREYTADLEKLL